MNQQPRQGPLSPSAVPVWAWLVAVGSAVAGVIFWGPKSLLVTLIVAVVLGVLWWALHRVSR